MDKISSLLRHIHDEIDVSYEKIFSAICTHCWYSGNRRYLLLPLSPRLESENIAKATRNKENDGLDPAFNVEIITFGKSLQVQLNICQFGLCKVTVLWSKPFPSFPNLLPCLVSFLHFIRLL